ncbi:MAG: hypothetical protein DKM50_02155 [Candidatus Margulisiibacteriota bacterium]|nr:MAG: hypothetical protein A2X43_06615 [Candidatus Margulisbacteria bacterium GWD2_39_127]OGI05308.1 MAG: hypothetical protein A2X42_03870 [Candidatus Margulisbacteria bacterium GWF2_38_17]OGI10833.1 MAG: hypothetical protein A2X41_05605 [Candidatus Margulisbacteria bacterium GWE2_39_32]PZM83519.1 MAG: hypothetical protein DKM50_02155 [Candidatus Margulisiibacteriota bacterium]HAR64304.1 hypothetical protein [Candidatus Margulisiibacteriota bacterium]
MKKFSFLFILFLMVTATNCVFADATATFKTANDYYKSQDYGKAGQLYLELADNYGIKNAGLFYNLGNTFYKQGNIGKSILYYEKALLLAPRDKDIKDNLLIAQSKVIDKVEPTNSFGTMLLRTTLAYFSMNEVSWVFWLAAISFLVGALVFINNRNNHRVQLTYYYAIIPLFILSSLWFSFKYVSYSDILRGIVLTEKVDVRSGPGESFQTLFVVHEGFKFSIVKETNSGWTRITLDNGFNGWIPDNVCGKINPL